MSKRYNRDTPWNSCRWLQKLIELYFRLLEWTIRQEFKMEDGLRPFTLIHDDLDALCIHAIEDIHFDWAYHCENIGCWDGDRSVTLTHGSLKPTSAASGRSLKRVSVKAMVKRIQFKRHHKHLPWVEIIGFLDRMYIHVERFMIQVDRTWDGPPRFRSIESGQKILEYIEAKPVDPQSLLIDLEDVKRKFLDDLDFVKRNAQKEEIQPIKESPPRKQKSPLFPMGDHDWSKLTITVIAPSEYECKAKFEIPGRKKTCLFSEIGLQRGGKLLQVGAVLLAYAINIQDKKSYFKKDSMIPLSKESIPHTSDHMMRRIISDIRKILKSVTGKAEDPFEIGNTHKGWIPKFTLVYDASDYISCDDASHPCRVSGISPEETWMGEDPREAIIDSLDRQKNAGYDF